MDIKSIDIGIDKIDKIYHVSDIHIRTLKRHTEYREVFDNLFDYIARTSTANSIAPTITPITKQSFSLVVFISFFLLVSTISHYVHILPFVVYRHFIHSLLNVKTLLVCALKH